MYIHAFGRHKRALPSGWTKETNLPLMSMTRLAATANPGDDAELTVVSILSGTKVFVPDGTRVEWSGGDILGSHRVTVEPLADGPVVKIQAIPVLGRITIRALDTARRERLIARRPPAPPTG